MSDHVETAKTTELDPVCGMTVDPAAAKKHIEHAGKTYYFCSGHCADKFRHDPAHYLNPSAKAGTEDSASSHLSSSHARGSFATQESALKAKDSATKQKDPVCGMDVDPATAKHTFEHAGKTYYFCCRGCLEKFRADPGRYLSPKASPDLVQLGAPASSHSTPPAVVPRTKTAPDERFYVCPMCHEVRQVAPGPCPSCGMALEPESPFPVSKTEYTCPMHPEIVRSEPGSCPICGMALEPRTVTAHEEENPELRSMSRRFWVSLVLTAPLLIIDMVHMWWPHVFMGHLSVSGRRLYGPGYFPWLDLHRYPFHQYVHADRDGHWRRLPLQPHRNRLPSDLSPGFSRHEWPPGRVFRSCRGHHHARPTGPGTRTPRSQSHQCRHPRVARSQPQDRAPHSRRGFRTGHSSRQSKIRRPSPRPARREGAGRRRSARWPQRYRRVHDHWRVHPG